jgi:hypothetical protein
VGSRVSTGSRLRRRVIVANLVNRRNFHPLVIRPQATVKVEMRCSRALVAPKSARLLWPESPELGADAQSDRALPPYGPAEVVSVPLCRCRPGEQVHRSGQGCGDIEAALNACAADASNGFPHRRDLAPRGTLMRITLSSSPSTLFSR